MTAELPKKSVTSEPGVGSAAHFSPWMKRAFVWSVIIGAGCIGISYTAFVVYWTWQQEGWVKDIIRQHFAATVGLPLAGVGGFLLVQILQISSGRIEFEAWGIKLRGASGPVVLWAITFVVIAFTIKFMW